MIGKPVPQQLFKNPSSVQDGASHPISRSSVNYVSIKVA